MTFCIHTDLFKCVFHGGSDEVFAANVSKTTTFNQNVLNPTDYAKVPDV